MPEANCLIYSKCLDSLLQTVMRVVNTDEVDGRPITGVLELLCEQFD